LGGAAGGVIHVTFVPAVAKPRFAGKTIAGFPARLADCVESGFRPRWPRALGTVLLLNYSEMTPGQA